MNDKGILGMMAVFFVLSVNTSFAMGQEEMTPTQVHDFAMSVDTDKDGIVNGKDNCPGTYNPDQKDSLKNGIGDACRPKEIRAKKRKS